MAKAYAGGLSNDLKTSIEQQYLYQMTCVAVVISLSAFNKRGTL